MAVEGNFARRDDLRLAPEPGDRKPYRTLAICALLLLAVWLVFGQTVHHAFVNLDDDVCISENPQITRGLSVQGVAWAFTNRLVGYWAPFTWISHMLDWRLYGPNAGGHHLTNLLLHAAAALLLFLVLQQMTARAWPSALASALFAIHPLRVESVAWVVERRDVLSGLFFMLALGAYVRYTRHRFSVARYLAVMILFGLGLMAKPMLVTLPCVLLWLDYWPLGRMAAPRTVAVAVRRVIEKVPLLTMAAVCCAATISSQRVSPLESPPLSWRIGNVLISYVDYLGQFFYPVGLAALYPRRGPELPLWHVFGAGLVLLGVTAAVFAWRRRCPYLLVGWLWYLVMLLPVIGLVPLGAEATADRFTYLPHIGVCIALAWGATDLCRSWPYGRWACGISSALAIVTLMGCAWRQTSFWRDSDTLWTRTLACTSQNYMAHRAYGNALAARGRIDEAVAQFQAAIAVHRDYPEAYYSLGVAAAGRGRLDEAIAYYRKAIAANPDYANAHNNLGNLLLARGQIDGAMAHCLEALRVEPDFPEAHYNLGNVLFTGGRLDDAMGQYWKALEIRPDYAGARYNLGLALAGRGSLDKAIAQYRKALEVQPDFAEVYNSLGLALVACGRRDEALAHYRKALEIKPDFLEARVNLGNALADRRR